MDTELLTSCESYTRQLEKMNKGEISDEVKWQTWNLEKEIDRVIQFIIHILIFFVLRRICVCVCVSLCL